MPRGRVEVVIPCPSSTAPKGRLYATMCPLPGNDSCAVLLGGCATDMQEAPPTAFVFNAKNLTWSEHACTGSTFNPLPKTQHTADVISDEEILLIGGYSQHQARSSAAVTLNTRTWTFTKRCHMPVSTMYAHATAVDKDRQCVYLFGGANHFHSYRDLYCLDLKTWSWEKMPQGGNSVDTAPAARLYHRACTVKRKDEPCKMYIHGGAPDCGTTRPDSVIFDDLWELVCVSNTWKRMPKVGNVPNRRGSTVMCHLEPFLFLYGGFDGVSGLGDAFLYDLDQQVWLSVSLPEEGKSVPRPRFGAVSFLYASHVFVFGGMFSVDDNFDCLDDMFVLSLEKLTVGTLKFLSAHCLVTAGL